MDRRAQMEARRQKILANAGSRLQKITGRLSEIPDQDVGDDHRNQMNGACRFETIHTRLEDEDREFIISQESTEQRQQPEITKELKPTERKCPIIVDCIIFMTLGVMIRFTFEYVPGQIPMPMFMPFFSIAIPRILISPWYQASLGGIFQIALTLGGVSQKLIRPFLSTLAFFRTLFKFFSLYLFTFVLTHLLVGSQILMEQ